LGNSIDEARENNGSTLRPTRLKPIKKFIPTEITNKADSSKETWWNDRDGEVIDTANPLVKSQPPSTSASPATSSKSFISDESSSQKASNHGNIVKYPAGVGSAVGSNVATSKPVVIGGNAQTFNPSMLTNNGIGSKRFQAYIEDGRERDYSQDGIFIDKYTHEKMIAMVCLIIICIVVAWLLLIII
jgi:hypothetical protein